MLCAATKAAVEEGIIAGGGSAYVHAAREVAKLLQTSMEGDEKTGAKIILKALEAPSVPHRSQRRPGRLRDRQQGKRAPGWPWASTLTMKSIVDMIKAGILDPAKVTRSASAERNQRCFHTAYNRVCCCQHQRRDSGNAGRRRRNGWNDVISSGSVQSE